MRIGIVGAGIAGLGAAHALAGEHEVVLFEAGQQPGGHVYTVGGVDMGFIVHNRDNYPRFTALLAELGIATRATTMSFSVALPDHEWGSENLRTMFADRRRRVGQVSFLLAVTKFLRRARADLGGALVAQASLDDYLQATRTPADVRERFVVPLAAALWSLAPDRCGEFPAEAYLRFLFQHGMLAPDAALEWRTIVGGSRVYVDALLARLTTSPRFTLRAGRRITRIARVSDVRIDDESFDRVIVATHADTALALLADPTDAEARTLGAFRYSENRTVLHRDETFLPKHVHAAWNYVADPDTSRVAVTYSMTRLQGLDELALVTLNPRREPADKVHEVTFHHPQFDRGALRAQRDLLACGAAKNTFYAGAHAAFGFHEDGLRSGLAAAARVVAV